MNDFFKDSSPKVKSEMNVVPMIDVLLVLLIVFMAASPVVSSSVEIELPKTQLTQAQAEQNSGTTVVVTVNRLGDLFITNTAINAIDTQVDAKALMLQLEAVRSISSDVKYFLKGDVDTPYRAVMHALEIMKSSGIADVNLVTETKL